MIELFHPPAGIERGWYAWLTPRLWDWGWSRDEYVRNGKLNRWASVFIGPLMISVRLKTNG